MNKIRQLKIKTNMLANKGQQNLHMILKVNLSLYCFELEKTFTRYGSIARWFTLIH